MSDESVKILTTKEGWQIRCPACRWHNIPSTKGWKFDGNLSCPTITPSMKDTVNPKSHKDYRPGIPTRCCHFTITAGKIKFHTDCSHELVGQTLDLEAWSEAEVLANRLDNETSS